MHLDPAVPPTSFPVTTRDRGLITTFGAIRRILDHMKQHIYGVINNQEIAYISQNDQPTPGEGRWNIWKDADATSGNPSHYIVYNDGGTVVVWASTTLVP